MCYTVKMRKQSIKETKKPIAVVTGGSSGIGKVLLNELRRLNYTVVSVSRTNSREADCDFFACDLSKIAQTEETARKIREKYEKIDLLINNAGLGISGATELLPEENVRYVMEVDYFAPLWFTRALLPALSEKSKIVMISSACALFALPYRGVYCSAKAALNMLSFGLRMELKPSKIDVVCICPGDIRTHFTQNRIKNLQTNRRYEARVENAQNKVDGREQKRMDANKAGKKIARIAVKKRGALYILGFKYKFFYFCSRIFSQNFMLKVTEKIFNPKAKKETV